MADNYTRCTECGGLIYDENECERCLQIKNDYKKRSMTVRKMIDNLSCLDPNSRLVITEDGYYSCSPIAKIFKPKFNKEINDIKYYAIGHSDQNYS
jgi:hypothetical protein